MATQPSGEKDNSNLEVLSVKMLLICKSQRSIEAYLHSHALTEYADAFYTTAIIFTSEYPFIMTVSLFYAIYLLIKKKFIMITEPFISCSEHDNIFFPVYLNTIVMAILSLEHGLNCLFIEFDDLVK